MLISDVMSADSVNLTQMQQIVARVEANHVTDRFLAALRVQPDPAEIVR